MSFDCRSRAFVQKPPFRTSSFRTRDGQNLKIMVKFGSNFGKLWNIPRIQWNAVANFAEIGRRWSKQMLAIMRQIRQV